MLYLKSNTKGGTMFKAQEVKPIINLAHRTRGLVCFFVPVWEPPLMIKDLSPIINQTGTTFWG